MRLRTSDAMAMVDSITDPCKVVWLGDAPEQVSRFKGSWEKVLGNICTKLDDEELRDLLVDQLLQSKEFDSEVKTYYHEYGKKTYAFLAGCVERYLSRRVMMKNR